MNKLLQYCVNKACESPYVRGQTRHYAVVTDRKGKIVGEGRNDYTKSHPLMFRTSRKIGLQKDCIHSEMLAIIRSKGKGEKIYVARVDSKGNPSYSAPCPVCAVLIKEAGIKSVEYTI